MRLHAALLSTLLLLLAAAALDADGWQRCKVGALEARCGTVDVPERRDRPDGRRIELSFVLLPASGESTSDDPIVVLEGGPGASVTHFAPLHAQTFAGARRHRPLLLVDQRGTGRSAALDCSAMAGFRELATPESVAACREELAPGANLAHYTTLDVVADLAEVLDRLGYREVNLFATSYGTRTALLFARRHPERLRTMTLMAPYPTTHNVLVEAGPVLDGALARLIEACSGDVPCAESFPRLATTVERLPRHYGDREEWGRFAAGLRMMLFFPLQAARVPQLLDMVDRAGRLPAPEPGPQAELLARWVSEGAFLSILCAEDAARTAVEAVRESSRGTFLGPGWGESLVRSCGEWPRRPLPPGFAEPVHARVPSLLLVGRLDPAMPPAWAREAAATLEPSRVVEIPQGQHSFIGMSGMDCLLGLIERFLAEASPQPLDPSCVAVMKRPAFAPAAAVP